MNGNPDQTVILKRSAVLDLVCFHDADQSNVHQASHVRRLVHEDHHVHGIAIVAQGRWDKTEIIRKCEALGKQAA
jgi:hypothetical protein